MEYKWDDNFMSKRRHLHWRANIIVGAINEVLKPSSVLDVGCATGDLVGAFLEIPVAAWGLDISDSARMFADPKVKNRIFIMDFTKPIWQSKELSFNPKFDLVLAIEFFSIIHPSQYEQVVINLTIVGNRFLVACAPEIQSGVEYWFKLRSLNRIGEKEDRIKSLIDKYKGKLAFKAFYNGLMYFEIT